MEAGALGSRSYSKGPRENNFAGQRALMRPSSKAREGRNLTGFNRRATQLGGMQQPSNPVVILARPLRVEVGCGAEPQVGGTRAARLELCHLDLDG